MYLLQAIYRHVSNCAQYFMRSHRRARVCACVQRALAGCSSTLAMQFMYVHLWQTIIIIDHSFHAKVNNNSIIELLLLLLLCMYVYGLQQYHASHLASMLFCGSCCNTHSQCQKPANKRGFHMQSELPQLYLTPQLCPVMHGGTKQNTLYMFPNYGTMTRFLTLLRCMDYRQISLLYMCYSKVY